MGMNSVVSITPYIPFFNQFIAPFLLVHMLDTNFRCVIIFLQIYQTIFCIQENLKRSSRRVFVQFIRVISVLNPFLFWILPFSSQITISIILFWGVFRKMFLPTRSTLNIELVKWPHNNHNNLYCQSSQGSLHREQCIQVISPSPRKWKYYTNQGRLVPVCWIYLVYQRLKYSMLYF